MINKHEMDQHMAGMRELIPRGWWALYQGSLEAGFDKSQSFALVLTRVLGEGAGGVYPPNSIGPESDGD